MNKKNEEVFLFWPLLDLKIPMEHFLIAALIVLALSSLASSKKKYLMETSDCDSCIWGWNNKAFFQFNRIVGPVCF